MSDTPNEPVKTPDAVNFDAPEIQAAIRKAVDAEVTGLKSKNSELLGKIKDLGERTKIIDGLGGDEGVKQLSEMRTRLQQDEDLKLFAEGKHEEYNERITRRAKADLQKQLEARDDVIKKSQGELEQLKTRLQKQIINEQVRSAASKAEMIPSAIDDALLHATNLFSLDENGNVIARNADGEIETGKDGKVLGIAEWLESMRDVKAHWWLAQGGMGAKPNQGGGNRAGPKSWSEAKTPAEKRAFLERKHPNLATG